MADVHCGLVLVTVLRAMKEAEAGKSAGEDGGRRATNGAVEVDHQSAVRQHRSLDSVPRHAMCGQMLRLPSAELKRKANRAPCYRRISTFIEF